MVVLGMWVRSNYYQIPSNHYSLIPEGTHYTVRIERVLKPNTYAFRYYGTIVQVNQSPSQGKILLIQKKEDGQLPLSVGHFILTKEIPFSIAAPKNPGAFDYAAYLKNLRIRDQIELSPQEYVCLTKQPAYGSDWLHQVKSNAIKRIQSFIFSCCCPLVGIGFWRAAILRSRSSGSLFASRCHSLVGNIWIAYWYSFFCDKRTFSSAVVVAIWPMDSTTSESNHTLGVCFLDGTPTCCRSGCYIF